ncbi:pathogenicity island protein [Staphylococcus simulans]|uniref:pathogenicity island protein n=1 Tax=Staphylococcus simulans TaxID=1286 RepID=UPI000D1D3455|nr:pathogenicity island protein [Staphylococcus simulans]PTJ28481.1 pathogenicity island protein [Staphylococcus simulans]RIN43062.1 pathogenicity island protein [Staphylococcus simulans]RIN67006.1 pathogenicity island protein [Staphylococcus simulans]
MKQQVIITKSVCGWFNVKNTDHELLLNIAPDVFKKHFPEVSEDICVACLELDISRILELKNKKKVGS